MSGLFSPTSFTVQQEHDLLCFLIFLSQSLSEFHKISEVGRKLLLSNPSFHMENIWILVFHTQITSYGLYVKMGPNILLNGTHNRRVAGYGLKATNSLNIDLTSLKAPYLTGNFSLEKILVQKEACFVFQHGFGWVTHWMNLKLHQASSHLQCEQSNP